MAKIYTRRGDDGSTGLFGGPRVGKDDLRVAAYGEVDELNSTLGVAREELLAPVHQDILAIVDALQSELFTLGAELATPDAEKAPREVPRIRAEMATRMEPSNYLYHDLLADLYMDHGSPENAAPHRRRGSRALAAGIIGRLTAGLPEMRQFILPGGSRAGAALHLCRTVCRRAERKVVQLSRSEAVSADALAYLNRLSDLLFVLARAANLRAGGREIPWTAPKP